MTALGATLEMDADLEAKLTAIEQFDTSTVRSSLMRVDGLNEDQAIEAELEGKRFLAIVAANPTQQIGIVNNSADRFWHNFVLHSKLYQGFCATIFGAHVHHSPLPKSEGNGFSPYETTLTEYEKMFGAPNKVEWPTSLDFTHLRWCDDRCVAEVEPSDL